jgi:hypothetical protein
MTHVFWKVVGSVVAVPMLIGGWYQAASTLAHEERILTEEVAAEGLTALEIDNEAGWVHLVGVEDAAAVTIRARVSDGWRSTQHELRREEGGRLVLRASCPNFGSEFCLVNYTIEVPAGLAVEVRGDEGVEVSDLTGPVYAESDASGVVAARISGDLTIKTDEGGVEATEVTSARVEARAIEGGVRLSFDGPPRSVVADSVEGGIEILLPQVDGVSYASEVTAVEGSVTEQIDESPDSDRTISAHTVEGGATVRYR